MRIKLILSKGIDDWLDDQMLSNTCWIVELSNGETIIQDDDRPGAEPRSAWERLGYYCAMDNLYIVNMRLKFRSHTEHVGRDADGFFFCRGIFGGIQKTFNSYLTGTLSEGILEVVKWQVPELIQVPFIDDKVKQRRNPNEAGPCLIRRPNVFI